MTDVTHKLETHAVYLGRSITFQLLRRFGWGQMLNLGWFSWPGALSPLNLVLSRGLVSPRTFLLRAQERLLDRSIRLLAPADGERVLDVGCGRGRSAFVLASRGRGTRVVGVDFDRNSVALARSLYGLPESAPNRSLAPSFAVGDATRLGVRDGSFDKLLALECAFHFEPRERFIDECQRVLRVGGKALIVDFAWHDRRPADGGQQEEWSLVKDTWAWKDFWTTAEYERSLRAAGFDVALEDWSDHVTRALSGLFRGVVALARCPSSRALLCRLNPLLRSFEDEHWAALQRSASAHAVASEHVRYLALLGQKR